MVFSLDKFSTYQSIPQAFFELAKESLDSALYEQSCIQADGSRPWVTRTFGESKSRIERLADYLGSIGVVVGSKVEKI